MRQGPRGHQGRARDHDRIPDVKHSPHQEAKENTQENTEDLGQHTAACIDRFCLVTAPVVQSHEDLPRRLRLPEGMERWRFLKVDADEAGGHKDP